MKASPILRRTAALSAMLVLAASCGGASEDGAPTSSAPTDESRIAATTTGPDEADGKPSTTTTTGAPAASDTTTPGAIPADVPEELAFTAPLIGGGEIDLASLAGQPVLLWFWAPWCPTCHREAESVRATAERWAGQVEFVGVAWQGSDDEYSEFVDQYSLEFPQVADDTGEYFARFGVAAQPAFAIVRPDGEVQTLLGAADEALLDSLIADAV